MKLFFVFFLFVSNSAFAKSSFNEVRDVILNSSDNGAEGEVYAKGKLPQYEVNAKSIFEFGASALERAAQRTVTDQSDYFRRLPKLLHPNGVCVMGQWQMDPNSPYTGAFASGSKLFIGRISVALEDTKAGKDRGFGFAGKIFSTQNPNTIADTANFFSVDVLMGTDIRRYLDTATTNEPAFGFNLSLIGLGLRIASALKTADENPGFRPVKNLAKLGLPRGSSPEHPKWIRIAAAMNTKKNNQADFRNEVLQAVMDNKKLIFIVEGSHVTSDREDEYGWAKLGQIEISEAVVSYGCDRRLHFAHPTLN